MSKTTGLPSTDRRTKIVCTLGPVSRAPDVIEELIRAGMNVVRINMSHGNRKEHADTIDNVRAVARRLGVYIPIMLDLAGPKMRIGSFKGDSVTLHAGDEFTLTSRKTQGDWRRVSVNYPSLIRDIEPGNQVLMGDGEIALEVESKSDDEVRCRVINGGQLHSKKGINAPGLKLRESVPTEKDIKDAIFGVEKGVDWLAQSFVRSVDDVNRLRDVLHEHASDMPIVVKIEKREAVNAIDELLDVADAVMIARGDLGLELPFEEVPSVQKTVVARALHAVAPSIVATQMLESMMHNPRPTRAEAADVYNAVLDGADAIMLSGETAAGEYPVEAVRTMAQIALASEARINYEERFHRSRRQHYEGIPEAVARAACDTAIAIGAKVIICCTRSGDTAAFVSNNRPPAKIAVVSAHDDALHRAMLMWHTHPIKISLSDDTDTMIAEAKQAVLVSGIALRGDRVVIVAAVPADAPVATNMIKVEEL